MLLGLKIEFPTLTITFGIAIGAVIAAMMNIAANYVEKQRTVKLHREESLKILFGELLHIFSHYKFSSIPMSIVDSDDRDVFEIKKRIRFSKYGNFQAIENVESFSFLSSVHVRNLYQLSLRIRNTDILIDDYLSSGHLNNKDVSSTEEIHFIREIDSRMDFISDTAELILTYISDLYPEYKKFIEETRKLEQPDFSV